MPNRVLSMVECFSDVEDRRQERGNCIRWWDVLCLAVLAVIAGAEGWEDIEEFGKQKQPWLRKFLRLPEGIPSHDTIGRVLRSLKPGAFQEAIYAGPSRSMAAWDSSMWPSTAKRCGAATTATR